MGVGPGGPGGCCSSWVKRRLGERFDRLDIGVEWWLIGDGCGLVCYLVTIEVSKGYVLWLPTVATR